MDSLLSSWMFAHMAVCHVSKSADFPFKWLTDSKVYPQETTCSLLHMHRKNIRKKYTFIRLVTFCALIGNKEREI